MTAVSPPATTGAPRRLTPEQLAGLRPDLLRFARLQLRNLETAEDLVQDSIEAALRHADAFAGRSTLKTWLFAILRNRIVDHVRQASHTVPLSSLAGEGEDWQEQLEALFDRQGDWNASARPSAWPDPEQSRREKEFWLVFETCLDHLPPAIARVFMMREFLGFESDEICGLVGISTSNCHVILHRARLKLRDCMERGWGRPAGASC